MDSGHRAREPEPGPAVVGETGEVRFRTCGRPCAVAVEEPETGHPVRHGHPQGEGAFRADGDHGHLASAPLARLATTADAAPPTWTHPGMLHNAGDINGAEVRVAAGTDPWLSGWNKVGRRLPLPVHLDQPGHRHDHPRRHRGEPSRVGVTEANAA
ncbi:hypothetical protein [Streptomyces canus]|uniref:hypothetical protein n=1 Tax=Streptomyces canus TaxID=58343 RepID=UPI00048AA425